MSARTLIQWCYYTFGWFGCTRVSPGCAHCYMFELARRYHASANVGPGRARVLPKYFQAAVASLTVGKRRGAPFTWDRECQKLGIRRGVFPSLCDPFDDEVPIAWFVQLLALIHATENLDWLLLTKRPEKWKLRMRAAWNIAASGEWGRAFAVWLHQWVELGQPPANVWVGASVENQEWADKRIPELLKIPARVRFLSAEPLLSAVDLRTVAQSTVYNLKPVASCLDEIDWVIVGGESGRGARPCNVEDVRSVVAQCQAAGVPVFVKQLGARAFTFSEPIGVRHHKSQNMELPPRWEYHLHLKHKKGGDMAEWPEDLQVREMPAPQNEKVSHEL